MVQMKWRIFVVIGGSHLIMYIEKTLCVHINHALDVEAFVARSLPDGRSKPTSLFFALNVGKDSSGNIFIASGSRSGYHWTMCHVDREKKKIVYGDSLAWSVPVDLLPRLEQFIEQIYGECLSYYSVFECHTSSNVSTERDHKCGFSCASQYPLQTFSDICGVVVLIMAVYACTARSFFSHITTSGQSQAVSPSNVFITRYAKYLRRVIMGWIGEKSINPEHVVPSSFLRPELSHESQSDSDSDLDTPRMRETTPRVPLSKGDIDERDNTAENNEKGLCIQRKAERAGRTESTQSSSEAEDKILDNKQLQKINDNHYKKVNKSKTEMTRPVKRNTVIFLLREWLERKMEKTRAIVTEQLTTMESLVMRRETVMTAQSIGQVVESSIEVNEEPGSLINVLSVNILVLNYQT
ncbi:unnamed protein product [Pocillopora meandrina]|uniref:Uncharacterized protein n=1 Tax=Pocillopora meandrina TaxID=46732 RepID=A0AAU9X0W5_9CNID|nr:unnamed protein product [Pocillopora meandrina]